MDSKGPSPLRFVHVYLKLWMCGRVGEGIGTKFRWLLQVQNLYAIPI